MRVADKARTMALARTLALAGAACALALAAPAHAADVAALAKAFGARPAARGMQMSPSGRRVSYISTNGPRGASVIVADVSSGDAKVAFSVTDGDVRPLWCHWKTETRLVCQVYMVLKSGGETNGYTRLIAFDADGANALILGQRLGYGSRIAYSGSVMDWLPDDADHIILQLATAQKIDIRTGKTENIESGGGSLDTDNHGNVRFKTTYSDKDGYIDDRAHHSYRAKGSKTWQSLTTTTLSGYGGFEYLGFDESGDNILALKSYEGRQALFSIATDGSERQTLLFAHPKVDIDGVLRIGKYSRPVAATYTLESGQLEFFDPALRKLTAALSAALPGRPTVTVYDESWDGTRKLILADSDYGGGRYMLFDTKTRSLGELANINPELAGLKAGEVTAIRYGARDGTQVPAYLTAPPGQAVPRNLPAIIMPHGGPTARDSRGFDWLAQFFAHLGYVVLQPNFRGSAGYGEAWYNENGFKNWAAAIGDVNDSARWLIAQGIADPKRIAIFGWSYGGYAALQANVLDPGLYRAAVAVAPVTDLGAMKAHANRYSNGELIEKMVGAGPHVTVGSPTRNADRIKVPVLLFHGDRDLNVDIEQSRNMDSALTSAGVKHDFILYKGLDHYLDDSDIRADMLRRSADWLAAAMAAP